MFRCKVHGNFHVPCRFCISHALPLEEIMLFEINFTTWSDFLATFNLFFRNLTSLNLLLTTFGKNFIKVADYCQKIGILEYPVCFKNVFKILSASPSSSPAKVTFTFRFQKKHASSDYNFLLKNLISLYLIESLDVVRNTKKDWQHWPKLSVTGWAVLRLKGIVIRVTEVSETHPSRQAIILRNLHHRPFFFRVH